MREKTKSQRLHTKRRCFERFGIELSNADLKNIVSQIQTGHAIKISRRSNTAVIYLVKHNGIYLPVLYDKSRHSIATVLPKSDPRVSKVTNPKPPRKAGSKHYVNRNGNGSKNGNGKTPH
ncbi:MAG: hypothetical protein AAB594_03100 [Patescibacteria group bacterium]